MDICPVARIYRDIIMIPESHSVVPETRQTRVRNVSHKEKLRIEEYIRGFDKTKTEAYRAITEKFGLHVNLPTLTCIAEIIIRSNAPVDHLDRKCKRRQAALFKWFHENWETIEQLWPYIVVCENPQKVPDDAVSLYWVGEDKKIQTIQLA